MGHKTGEASNRAPEKTTRQICRLWFNHTLAFQQSINKIGKANYAHHKFHQIIAGDGCGGPSNQNANEARCHHNFNVAHIVMLAEHPQAIPIADHQDWQ